jgi:REP element-mobilizing transposase RayT
MPSRHEIKHYTPGSTYHVFNRGVDRRRIYIDSRDYHRFLDQIRRSLISEPDVDLLAYCLMPNHFHLLLRQAEGRAASRFMQRLSIAYVMYFNKRYKRVGPLFQGKYKAVDVLGPLQLMEVSRYIHLNPARAGLDWRTHPYSSRNLYLDRRTDALVNVEPVLGCFDTASDYWHYLNYRRG